MNNIFGKDLLKDLSVPQYVKEIIEVTIKDFRKEVKHQKTVDPYYLMIDRNQKTYLVPNLGEQPTDSHVSYLRPVMKSLDIEYLILFAEGSMLLDGKKRSEEDWQELFRRYGSLNNHPEKTDTASVVIFSPDSTASGCAIIKPLSAKKRTRTFGELRWNVQDSKEMEGNLSGFFD